ncbi:MAG: hydrogenase maturation protease [Gammaproteobacteria bacterium]|nr:hydrogenase maturation protease [Gammaproteobacteria bacterium]
MLGIGQAMRGDDAAGIEALRWLRDRYPELDCEELTGDPAALLNAFANADHVVVLDCVAAKPGDTQPRVIDGLRQGLSAGQGASTHAFSLREAIELGRALGRLPERLTIFGIPGHDFELGASMSTDTCAALARLTELFPKWRQQHA